MTAYLSTPKVLFENRRDAGSQLAALLEEYTHVMSLVLAIPNGGVPIGMEVATSIKTDLDLIICRKIPLPLNPEAGLGAIADDGTIILNEEIVRSYGLTREQIDYEATAVRTEIKKRSMQYRGDRPLESVHGKTVIIVDDGLASGFTMLAAIESVRRRRPREIVAAVPVASATAMEQVEKAADKVITCAVGTMPRFAVADYYRNWHDLKTDDVLRSLERWRREKLK